MRRPALSFLPLLTTFLLLAGCGPTQEQYGNVVAQLNQARTELDECRNGARRLLGEAEDALLKSDYDRVATTVQKLQSLHPGAPEVGEAAKLLQIAQTRQEEALRRVKAEEANTAREQTAKEKALSVIDVLLVAVENPEIARSTGIVNAQVVWKNTSEKTVKYATFTLVPYNAVGDQVASEYLGLATGPFSAGGKFGDDMVWTMAWRDPSIVRIELKQIRLDYMDGSVRTLRDKELQYVVE